jgi:hexokinase
MAILHELFGERAKKIKLELIRDGSGIGSAIIAAVAASGRDNFPHQTPDARI